MKYSKPKIKKVNGKCPPITTNFAPPPVELCGINERGRPQYINKKDALFINLKKERLSGE
jgi:hypothetical protein